jgi:hypothetical protein
LQFDDKRQKIGQQFQVMTGAAIGLTLKTAIDIECEEQVPLHFYHSKTNLNP